jgi:hypothetical protein
MNKILCLSLAAGSLLLVDSPEAAAHQEVRFARHATPYYGLELRRSHHMPHWLKRNKSFRQWYRHSRLRKNSYIAWHQLFDIYRWENIDRRKHRKAARIAERGHYSREHDRHRRHGRKH